MDPKGLGFYLWLITYTCPEVFFVKIFFDDTYTLTFLLHNTKIQGKCSSYLNFEVKNLTQKNICYLSLGSYSHSINNYAANKAVLLCGRASLDCSWNLKVITWKFINWKFHLTNKSQPESGKYPALLDILLHQSFIALPLV